ncbi:MAG: cyclic nucleotide-binding domain-containing protein [Calditrichaceae bacterium]|jgi:CRP-like cAMP-binding protein
MLNSSDKHLEKIPLFSHTDAKERERIAEKLTLVSFKRNNVIIKEGDQGNCLYLIKNGRVRVVSTIEPDNEEIILSYLEDGDYFGEMALITGEPRSATVIAESDIELYKLDKTDFDALILKNPNISISLTHVLTQRLQMANKSRENSERYYKSRITPSGYIKDTDLVKLLKFAEENSLTGKIVLRRNQKEANFHYRKGQLEKLDFEGKSEDEAMDELFTWPDGEFKIEPSIFKFSSTTELEITETTSEQLVFPQILSAYLHEKFSEFIRIAGSRITQTALNKSYHKFRNYFSMINEIQIRTTPELEVEVSMIDQWTDKHVLFSAVLLRDVVNTIEKDLVGMKFWSNLTNNETINNKLKELQFFEYYDQAIDLIKD